MSLAFLMWSVTIMRGLAIEGFILKAHRLDQAK